MADGYGCADDQCHNQINWIITRTAPSGTVATCAEHFPVFMIPMIAAELGVDPMRLYDSIKRFTDREAAREARAAAAQPSPEPEPDQVEEPEQEPYDPGPEVDDQGGMSEYRANAPSGMAGWE